MGVATCRTISLHGPVGHLVDVQVDVSPGAVGATLVGRADPSLQEARERCRMAITNSNLDWPSTRRTTILLSPADLAKRGTTFDLAIAVAVCAATGQLGDVDLGTTVLIGELTLDGGLRCVPGVLPMALAAADRGIERVMVPEPQAAEAAMVPGLTVFGVRSLAQAVAVLTGAEVPEAPPVARVSGAPLLHGFTSPGRDHVDLADLDGLEQAKFALEVAAAGGHHLLLNGPKGAGKTSLVERLPGILPALTRAESLELTVLHSLAGTLQSSHGLIEEAPYFAPHHAASAVAVLGGGTGRVRPGGVSLAHLGVLFLDELALFRTDVIDGLREPLENGEITVARGDEVATYPARSIFVAAANPCPCGYAGIRGKEHLCRCDAPTVRHYTRRLRGPVLDRVDIQISVRPETAGSDGVSPPEPSAQVAERVARARARQHARYAGRAWHLNGHVPTPVLAREWPLGPQGRAMVEAELRAGRLTRRGSGRVHRLAWTVADLAGHDEPHDADVQAALALRQDQPLQAAVLGAGA